LLKGLPLNVKEKFEGLCLSNGISSFFFIDLFPSMLTDLILIASS
jgi:hypothetical protein